MAQRILKRLVEGGARIPVILDRTAGGRFKTLYVSVGWRGRALPLVWGVLGPGASSFAQQKELSERVGGWLLKGARVRLLWGAQVIASGYQKVIDSVRQPPLSLFQTGLRFIQRLRDHGIGRYSHRQTADLMLTITVPYSASDDSYDIAHSTGTRRIDTRTTS